MNNDITIIIRSCGERTTYHCENLILQQVPKENIFVINEIPFSKAVEQTFRIGLKQNKKWTLAIDADILVFKDSIVRIIETAENYENKNINFFEYQGRIFDKLFGINKSGGPHLYKTELIPIALKFFPLKETLRPESDVFIEMSKKGYSFIHDLEVYGLHDFEQYYKDIYRKCFVHAHKFRDQLINIVPYWMDNEDYDKDFKVALKAFHNGLKYAKTPTIDKSSKIFECSEILKKLKIKEKAKLDKINVKNILNGHVKIDNLEYESNFCGHGVVNLKEKQNISFINKINYKVGTFLKKVGNKLIQITKN